MSARIILLFKSCIFLSMSTAWNDFIVFCWFCFCIYMKILFLTLSRGRVHYVTVYCGLSLQTFGKVLYRKIRSRVLVFHCSSLLSIHSHRSTFTIGYPLFIPIFDMYFYVFKFSLYTYPRVVFTYMYIW